MNRKQGCSGIKGAPIECPMELGDLQQPPKKAALRRLGKKVEKGQLLVKRTDFLRKGNDNYDLISAGGLVAIGVT